MSVKILADAMIITMDTRRTILPKASIIIRDGLIEQVTDSPDYVHDPQAEVIDMSNRVIMPGFFNAHTHIAMAPFRGIVHDQNNILYDIIWPIEMALEPEDCYHLARLGALEALQAGTTCVADHYFHMNHIAEGIVDIGIRGVVGETIMDRGGPFSSKDSLERGIRFWEKWRKKNPLIVPVLAPHGPDTVALETLKKVKDFCEQNDTRYHMHVAQTRHETDIIFSEYGVSSVQYLHQNGILGPRLSAAHCIYTDQKDICLLKETGSHVLYCPSTHAFTGFVAPVHEMVQAGVNVCLGTDFVAENDDHNMLEEMRLATMLQKVVRKDPASLPTKDVLPMAICNGPNAYGLGDFLGSLEAGKAADMIAFDLCAAHLTPHYNIVNAIVYAASAADIDCVMINGRFLIRDKKTIGINEKEIILSGQNTCDRILRKALETRPELAKSIDPYVITN